MTIATLLDGKDTLTRQKGHARFGGFLGASTSAVGRYIVSVNAIGTSASVTVETRFHAGFLLTTATGLQLDALVVVHVVLSSRHDDTVCVTVWVSIDGDEDEGLVRSKAKLRTD
jgi:hypothetical protein